MYFKSKENYKRGMYDCMDNLKCEYCEKEMSQNESMQSVDGNVCCAECRERIQLNELLEKDAVLKKLNNKYAAAGLIRFIFGIFVILMLWLMKKTLDSNWSDTIGIFAMLFGFAGLIVFAVSCILRGVYGAKIKKELKKRNLKI